MDILKIFVYKHESYCLKEKKKQQNNPPSRRKNAFISEVSYKLHLHLYLKDKSQDTGTKAPLNCTDGGWEAGNQL